MTMGLLLGWVVAIVAVSQAVIGALFWAFRTDVRVRMLGLKAELIEHMDTCYVRAGECVLRDASTRELLKATGEEGRAACIAAAQRDAATQDRISELVNEIAKRAAEAILRDREILSKIDLLLHKK